MNYEDVRMAIFRGELDDELIALSQDINLRFKARRAFAARTLAVGTKVRIADTPDIRAKERNLEFIGLEGTVIRRNPQTVTISTVRGELKLPATLLEVV